MITGTPSKKTKQACCETTGGPYYQIPCRSPAIVKRQGYWYCRHHDPEYIKLKHRASQEGCGNLKGGLKRWLQERGLPRNPPTEDNDS